MDAAAAGLKGGSLGQLVAPAMELVTHDRVRKQKRDSGLPQRETERGHLDGEMSEGVLERPKER